MFPHVYLCACNVDARIKQEKEAARLAKEAAAEAAKKKAEEGPEIMDAQEAYNDARVSIPFL
jgi:hypothetical protein